MANYESIDNKKSIKKTAGQLNIISYSRIHPTKNLLKSLEIIKDLKGDIQLNIYGPINDKEYWSLCKEAINQMPSNVKVAYKGVLQRSQILDAMYTNHVFLLPTLGENYGHVISEALIGACPVIISDQTPWQGLKDAGVGANISLKNHQEFVEELQFFTNMNQKNYDKYSRKAYAYAKQKSKTNEVRSKYLKLLS